MTKRSPVIRAGNSQKPKASAAKQTSLARERLEGRVVGGRFSELANYSDLFDRSRDGIILVDLRNLEILETNPSFRELLQTDENFEGSTFTTCFQAEAEERIRVWLESSTSLKGGAGSIDLEMANDSIVEFSCAKVQLADYCEVLQVIARDVTEERNKSVQLEKQSLTDEMTGLSNFRSFKSRLALEHERATLRNQPYAVAFFDVDHFKHFNDRNGHPAGDEALRHLARTLRSVSDRTEFVARYGGEEFVVLCANADLDAGTRFAEKARAAIEAEIFKHGEGQPLGRVTVSIGVASFEAEETPDAVLKNADAALYDSKKNGRNRVTAFDVKKKKVA